MTAARTTDAAPRPIKVASYNMRKAIGLDRRRDPMRTLAVLAELDADIVALQEADRRFGSRASAIPYHMFLEHSDYRPVDLSPRQHSIGWHGNALLVRKGIEVESSRILTLPTVEPRGAVVATVRVGDAPVRVVGMHLDISGLQRRRQTHAILRALGSDEDAPATVLMGDLNEWREQGACLRELRQHHVQVDTGMSFHARRPVARLDRIFVSSDLTVLDSGVHISPRAASASDHLPIWATLVPTIAD